MPTNSNLPQIHSITVHDPITYERAEGDTWMFAWMRDNTLYSPTNDGWGFGFGSGWRGNLVLNRLAGERPDQLTGEVVDPMTDYGSANIEGPDLCTWKSSGCIAVDGVLYYVVARHQYGEKSGDPHLRQPAHDASLIKSTDGGKTWTRSERENYEQPMFPGSAFAAPYFVNFGQDGHESVVDLSDKYVYAISNNGFWDNGDHLVLGRVLRSKIANLSGTDWQFLARENGASDANWSAHATDAVPILKNPNHLGSSGAVYLPAWKCYLLIGWYYPAGGGKIKDASKSTKWDFYLAPHPWGPWRTVGSHDYTPQGYYCPNVCPKFTSADGRSLWVFTAGDFYNPTYYRLTAIQLTLA